MMKFIYPILLLILIFSAMIFGRYKKKWIRTLDSKQHPFRLFYPVAAKLTDLFRKHGAAGRNSKVRGLLRSLYVKENVEEEIYAYTVKKVSIIFTVLTGAALIGTIVCVSQAGAELIRKVERGAPGEGEQTYELQVDYQGKSEKLNIPVEEKKYSEEEIQKLFDDSIEDIKKEALGENENANAVSHPMRFPSNYGKISLYWEIEDSEILGYDGEIRAELKGEESLVLNLYVTLSLDEVSRTYNFPVVIRAPEQTDQELLVEEIVKDIKEHNGATEKEVNLPETIGGSRISFRKVQEDNEAVILILSLLAIVVIALGYDRMLENKVKKRKEEMMVDFAEIVSKMSLLYEAGSSILRAWEKIVEDQEKRGVERYAYKEMKLALEKIKSGVSEREVYAQFGKRCGLHPYIKLGNILEQNLSKGTKGMKLLLKQETADAFEARKRLARKKGEEAGTKMLVPMILMMLVVIVIIAVPALMAIQL